MISKFFSAKPVWENGNALIRIGLGILIMQHGLDVFDSTGMKEMAGWLAEDYKLPMPTIFAYLAKGSEFFCGFLLVLGLFTRAATFFLICTMAFAVFITHEGEIFGDGGTAFLYLLFFTGFLFIGPGKWSLDYLLFNKKLLNNSSELR